MNTILTDDERRAAIKSVRHGMFTEPVPDDVARAVEAAVLAKLREPQEPVRRQCVVCDTVYEDGVPPQVAAPQQSDLQRVPEGWKMVPVEPTPESLACAAVAVLNTASAKDLDLAKKAARIVLEKVNVPHGMSLDLIASSIATMAPAYRAMLAAAPEAPAQAEPCLVKGDCKHGAWCSENYCQEHCQFVKSAQASAVDERAAFEAWWKSEHRLKSDSAAQAREAFHAGAAHARGETAV